MQAVIWQVIDSGFPSGGFAHSGGLEAASHHGLVRDADDVRRFARQSLMQSGRSALPFVNAAHDRPGALAAIDATADVFLSNPVANRASRAQGRALVTALRRAFSHASAQQFAAAADGLQAAHCAPLFGAALRALDVTRGDTQRGFLFVAVRGITSAGVRLGLVGSYQAQAIQADLASDIERVIARCGELGPPDAAQTAPLIDLCQSTHDRLYSRLFQS